MILQSLQAINFTFSSIDASQYCSVTNKNDNIKLMNQVDEVVACVVTNE